MELSTEAKELVRDAADDIAGAFLPYHHPMLDESKDAVEIRLLKLLSDMANEGEGGI